MAGLAGLTICLWALPFQSSAEMLTSQDAKLGPDITGFGRPYGYFGSAVSLSADGRTALIGAPNNYNVSLTPGGCAYVLSRSGDSWVQQAVLGSSDEQSSDQFGGAVSLSADGNTAIVGAHTARQTNSHSPRGYAYVFTRQGTNWTQQAKLEGSDTRDGDYFGNSVALSSDGNTVIIGAMLSDTYPTNSGSAYVFVRDGGVWSQQSRLAADDAAYNAQFGCAVAISGDGSTVLVGANRFNQNQGAAYVFVRNGADWVQQKKFVVTAPATTRYFGGAVALSEDGHLALVGAAENAWPSTENGAAFVFTRAGTNWNLDARLIQDDGETLYRFGNSVSVNGDGNRVLIAAHRTQEGSDSNVGAACLFTHDSAGWRHEWHYTAATGNLGDQFGSAVSLSRDGNTALVGAAGDDTPGGIDAGTAHLFVSSGGNWTEQAVFDGGDSAYEDGFGDATSLSGDGNTALVGAKLDDTEGGLEAGSVSVFVRTDAGWSRQATLVPDDGAKSDNFGNATSLSFDGNTALIGAMLDDTFFGPDAGSAYVFVREQGVWRQQSKFVPTDGLGLANFGYSVAISSNGTTAMVGAAHDYGPTNAIAVGSANIFEWDGSSWIQQPKLRASDWSANSFFGNAVSLSADGHTALIGAFRANKAYIFQRGSSAWQQMAILTPTNRIGDWFGMSVALNCSGDTALVGCADSQQWPGGYHSPNLGSVFCFIGSGSNWTQQAKLQPGNPQSDARFGRSVALGRHGNLALVGASDFSKSPLSTMSAVGIAYCFVRDHGVWSQQAVLEASDGVGGDLFGGAVAVSDDGLTGLLGAAGDSRAGTGEKSGSAYVFGLGAGAAGYNKLTVQPIGNGMVRLTYVGEPTVTCVLERTFDVSPGAFWFSLETNVVSASGFVVLTNSPAPNANSFWRMRLIPSGG